MSPQGPPGLSAQRPGSPLQAVVAAGSPLQAVDTALTHLPRPLAAVAVSCNLPRPVAAVAVTSLAADGSEAAASEASEAE